MSATYDTQRAAALWPIDGEGEHVARCLYQAMREHVQHMPCDRFACVQDRTLDLAFEPFEDDGMGSAGVTWAVYLNSLAPMIDDFRAQVREASEAREETPDGAE